MVKQRLGPREGDDAVDDLETQFARKYNGIFVSQFCPGESKSKSSPDSHAIDHESWGIPQAFMMWRKEGVEEAEGVLKEAVAVNQDKSFNRWVHVNRVVYAG